MLWVVPVTAYLAGVQITTLALQLWSMHRLKVARREWRRERSFRFLINGRTVLGPMTLTELETARRYGGGGPSIGYLGPEVLDLVTEDEPC